MSSGWRALLLQFVFTLAQDFLRSVLDLGEDIVPARMRATFGRFVSVFVVFGRGMRRSMVHGFLMGLFSGSLLGRRFRSSSHGLSSR